MKHFVVMGVASSGKSTIAQSIATKMAATFIEADSLHGDANIAKMAGGTPLNDEDRWPWLQRVAQAMVSSPSSTIVSCSALKRTYRDVLRDQSSLPIGFVHLHSSRDVIASRMAKRSGHFMPTSLLDSQLAILEPLEADEKGRVVDINQSIDLVVDEAMRYVNVVSA